MLGIGDKFPEFRLTGIFSAKGMGLFKNKSISEFEESSMEKRSFVIQNDTFKDQWQIYFFWPKDFTFVCPTEIVGFSDLSEKFKERNAQVIGASVDSDYVHLAWIASHDGLKNISFPLLSDVKRELSHELGIIDKNAGVSQRATFIVDPKGIIRFVYVTDLGVGRSPDEVLRVLDGLQNGGLCPVNWKKGDATL